MRAFFAVAGWILISIVLSVPLFVVCKLFQGVQQKMAGAEWIELREQWASGVLVFSGARAASLEAGKAAAPPAAKAPSVEVSSSAAVELSSAAAAGAVSSATLAVAVSSPVVAFELGTRDPFASPVEVAEVKAVEEVKELPIDDQIELQGIISSGKQNSAIVNNEVRKLGDLVLGAKIVKITDSTVYFRINGRTFTKEVEGGVIQR